MLKSSFMLTEVIFAISSDEIHHLAFETCVNQLFIVIDAQMTSLNTDILSLNASLAQD